VTRIAFVLRLKSDGHIVIALRLKSDCHSICVEIENKRTFGKKWVEVEVKEDIKFE